MKKMLSVLLFSLFIVTNLTANHASALTYNNTIDLEYTFNPSLDVSFNTNTGFIIEDLAPGNASYSNTVVITASSNNSDGYNLLASVGDSNDVNRNNNRLVNTNNVNYFESVAANADLELSALGENKWGYAICNDNDSSSSSNTTATGTCATWSNYNGLPAIVTDTNGNINHNNDITLASSNTAGTTDVLMKIGASATNTQVAGEFTNKINFFVTTNVVTYDYSITYNANDGSDGSSVANMPTNVAGSLNTGDILQTSSSIPTRSNYLFFGWCDGTVDNTTNGTITSPVCTNGNVYQANGYIKIANAIKTDGTNNTLNSIALTAMWGKYAMQNVDLWSKSIKINEEVTAIDERDGKEYTVARLADGNIWMTQNLDHNIGDIVGGTYTPADTDISSNWTPSSAEKTYATGTTTWSNSGTAPESYDPGDLCWNGMVQTSGGTIADSTVACGDDKHYHIGNYYNWTAAVAMSDSSSYTTDNQDVNQSICPAGWRLPIGGTTNTGTKSFQYLVNHQSLTAGTSGNIQNSPVYFVYGGSWRGFSERLGLNGLCFSSVVVSSSSAYRFLFTAQGSLNTVGYNTRGRGDSVRCVAR